MSGCIKVNTALSVDDTLQVLARYNHDLPAGDQLKELEQLWPGEVLPPKSCHASKGLEADYVIISDVVSGRYGFPSEQQDDPLMSLVLASQESFPHAEERRLLYVGMTCARKMALLVSSPGRPSDFCEELLAKPGEVFQRGLPSGGIPKCPTCGTGRIVPGNTTGLRCTNHPVCKFRAAICPECNDAPLHRVEDQEGKSIAICSNQKCSSQLPACQSCRSGVLIKKRGRHGDFLACHLFTTTGCKGKAR